MSRVAAKRIASDRPKGAWADEGAWEAKLTADRARADRNQNAEQRRVTETVLARAVDEGAQAVALTGSTARACRTEISDLDFHVVGSRPRSDDLPADVDIYAGDGEHFWSKLRSGDDFVQWTLRYGCVLVDNGIFRAGARAIAEEGLWPDGQAKLARLPEHVKLATRLIGIGDPDAAQTEVRAALTTAARGVLLEARVFPLSRDELADQLRDLGHEPLARALRATIRRERSLTELEGDLAALNPILNPSGSFTPPDNDSKRTSNELRRTRFQPSGRVGSRASISRTSKPTRG